MKRILSFITVFALLLTSCEGDPGPPGPQGPPGDGSGSIISSAFEIELDFTSANNYEIVEPYGFEVLPSDVTLVYIEWELDNGTSIWRLLPQTVEFDDGFLTYNFDFTDSDVRIFLDGTTDFSTLGDVWTQDQYFRVVVIPADNVDGLDISNLNEVMEMNQIDGFNLR